MNELQKEARLNHGDLENWSVTVAAYEWLPG